MKAVRQKLTWHAVSRRLLCHQVRIRPTPLAAPLPPLGAILAGKKNRPKGYWKHMYIEKQETHPGKIAVRDGGRCESPQLFVFALRTGIIYWYGVPGTRRSKIPSTHCKRDERSRLFLDILTLYAHIVRALRRATTARDREERLTL